MDMFKRAVVGIFIGMVVAFFAPALTAQAQGPVLDVTMDFGSGSMVLNVDSGQEFSFFINYRCASALSDCQNAVITDTLPSALQFITTVSPPSHVTNVTFDAGTNTVVFNFVNPLPAGSTGLLEVKAKFPSGTLPGTQAVNFATSFTTDGIVVSNNATATAQGQFEMYANKVATGAASTGVIGTDFNTTYQLQICSPDNIGGVRLLNPEVSDPLPAKAVYISSNPAGTYDSGTHTVNWTYVPTGTLPSVIDVGGCYSIDLVVQFPANGRDGISGNADDPIAGEIITNTVVITGTPEDGTPPVTLTLPGPYNLTLRDPYFADSFSKTATTPSTYDGLGTEELAGGPVRYDLAYDNIGTITATNVIITDTVPVSHSIVSIDVNPVLSPLNAFYELNNSGVWNPLPGNPYAVTATVTITDLGVAGDAISGIRWEIGTVPYGSSWAGGFDATLDPALTAGTVLTNCADYEATWDNGGTPTLVSGNRCATVTIIDQRAIPRPTKSMPAGPYNPGEVFTITLVASNDTVAHNPVEAPIILADLMPPGLEIVVADTITNGGYRPALTTDTWYSLINADGATAPTATITLSGTQQLAKWEWGPPYRQLPGHFTEVEFTVRVKKGTPPGTLYNRAYMMWNTTTVNPLLCTGDQVYTDTLDLNGNGSFTDVGCQTASQPVNISVFLSMDSEKFVWGELDAGWNKLGWTVPGGYVDWQMIITNTSNVSTSNIVMYDILPYIGDTGVIATWENRGSQWRPNMQSPVTAPSGVPLTVSYSQSQNPCRTEVVPAGPAGCVNDWTTTFPADPTSVQAIKLDFCDSGGANCLVLAPETDVSTGGVVTFTWHMVAPNLAPENQIAWNSFGFTASGGGKQLLPAEPIRVGVQLTRSTVTPLNLGDYVWLDVAGVQNDGIQQPEEPGINGARVELHDATTNNLIDYRYTGPDQYGNPGYYLFTNLTTTTYYLEFFPPISSPFTYTATIPNAGADDTVDSDGELSGVDVTYGAYSETTTINLVTDTLAWDMGYWVPTDYGDAPQDGVNYNYPVQAATQPISAALAGRHIISPSMYLGNGVDAELDGQPSLDALGDDTTAAPDDEDGVQFANYLGSVAQPAGVMFIGRDNALTITATSPFTTAYLNAWIDFNGDGDWDDAGEQIATARPSSGTFGLTVVVPTGAISGTTYARFRYSTQAVLTPYLTAPDGEVEDYRVVLVNSPAKSIVSTTDADTTAANLSIGEKVRFRLVAPIPEGTLPNFTITDALPAGLQFITGTVTTAVTGTSVTSTSFTVTGGPFGDGTDPVFNFGTVTNGDADPDEEAVVVEFDAQVLNTGSNINGTTLDNLFTVSYDTVSEISNPATVTIVEPVLHIGKTYVTPNNCGATLYLENFNDNLAQDWSGSSGWTVANGTYRQSTAYRERFYNLTSGWTDYSYSLMVRPDTNDSSVSVYFRRLDSNNYYRLDWQNLPSPSLTLIRRVGGSNTTQSLARSFAPGHWYHVEVKGFGDTIQVFIDGELVFTDTSAALTGGQIGIRTNGGTGLREFDDILVTKMDDMGCTIGANQLITYTLFISNQWTIPGYDLVITDSLPISTSFVSYAFSSDDGASTVKPGLEPTVGATGVITWGVTQLTNENPFTGLSHPGITITVVAQVDAGVPANTILPSQVWLAYDNKVGSPGLGFERIFSGGSHSTALKTVSGDLLKAVTFSPQPTATLGSLVTYTLTAPTTPITATLYGVVITDQLQTPRYFIENVAVTGGTNPAAIFDQATGLITATFDNILAGAQATITVTARISHAFPSAATDPNGGDAVTNTAVLSHTAGVIVSNVVTTTVHEPRVSISKSAAVVAGNPQAIDYTVTVSNNGDADAFDLTITDATPGGTIVSNIGQGGGLLPDNRTITWTIASLAVGASQNLTYRLTLSEAIYATNLFTNTAIVTNTSLTDTIPGVRTYVTDTVHTFALPMGRIGDYVWLDADYDGVQGGANDIPIDGIVVNLYDGAGHFIISTTTAADGSYIFQYLPLSTTYVVQLDTSNFTIDGVLEPYTTTLTGQGTPATDSNADANAIFLGNGYAVTTTLTTAITEDLTLDYGFTSLMSLGNQVWWDINDNGFKDTGEPTLLNYIAVELYADANGDGVFSTGDNLISTTVTTGTGNYTFTNLYPGDYLVVITATNFISGGILEDVSPGRVTVSGNSDQNNWNHGAATGTLGAGGYVASTVTTLIGNTEPITDGDADINSNLSVDFGFVLYDLGDLPDDYGTLLAGNGARHTITISPTFYMGSRVDAETDGQPSVDALGDDSNDSAVTAGFGGTGDDEDGVQWTPFVLGETSTFTVTVSQNGGYLNGWIDFNGNGTFDAGEQVVINGIQPAGASPFTVTIPATTTLDNIYMRFRFSTVSGLAPTGDAPDGEVEDYATTAVGYDFGDLPDSYRTTLGILGARHTISDGLYLGARVDAETDGQPGPTATNDDAAIGSAVGAGAGNDEDGVTWTPLVLGQSAIFTVTASQNNAYLNAWIDFDGDGNFTLASDHVISGTLLSTGVNTFSIPIPADAVSGDLYMRFRYSTQQVLASNGFAPDGEVEDYVTSAAYYDLGDLPDVYGTTLASFGARHAISPTLYLGNRVDAEGDGQPSTAALDDDANTTTTFGRAGSDDEDGVSWSPFVLGQTATLTVTSASTGQGYVSGWVDFNGDGDFADAGEQLLADVLLGTGVLTVSTTVPATATTGLYMRFRYSTQTELSPIGDAPDGEVEDYLAAVVLYDFGDLPESPYPTTLAQNGARHIIQPAFNPTLGATVDNEADGQPNATATGDDLARTPDDEDGVQLLTPLVAGQVATFTITAANTGDARLVAWMDFNGDGDFADTGELIFNNISLVDGANVLTITVPTVILSDTINARFRYSVDFVSAPTGEAADGEVEDYQFNPTRLVSLGDLVWFDYNNDGVYQPSTENGASGVMMELFNAGDTVGVSTPVATTTTNSAGRYLFRDVSEGGYFVYIPPTEFTAGQPLYGYDSSVPTQANPNTDQNEDVDENGVPVSGTADIAGVSSGVITVTVGTEPIGDDVSGINPTTPDTSSNLTVDFGFYPANAGITVVKTVETSPNVNRATVRYTITVTNSGQIPLFPVVLTDTLPAEMQLVPGTFSPISPTVISGQTMGWDNIVVSALQPGQATQVGFDAQITAQITGTYINVVTGTGIYTGGVVTDTGSVPIAVRDPAVMLSKGIVPPGAVNGVITYTINVTNTGASTLDVLPLFDYYDSTYLGFTSSTPAPDQTLPGEVRWFDLTQSFGRNLQPGETFVVTTTFAVLQPITLTVNTATVSGTIDIYLNPAPPITDTATITNTPTLVTLASFSAEQVGNAAQLRWTTASELDTRAFFIYRAETSNTADAVEISGAIPAQGIGGGGASYTFTDDTVSAGKTYYYWLTDLDNGGTLTWHPPLALTITADGNTEGYANRLYLPLILK